MKTVALALFAASLLATGMPGCAPADDAAETNAAPGAEQPLTVTETVEATVTARVKAVDHETRIMTIESEDGDELTFVVDESVQRLHEILPGDNVVAGYRATLVAELRPPTAEELADPVAVVAVTGRTADGDTPAGVRSQTVRIVTTVEAIDIPNMQVTLRGPMGDVAVVKARSEENIRRLSVGDTIVLTMTESVAVALEKVAVG
jgi:hypothetical protein